MNSKVDIYLVDGCGRCPLGGTPQCKVNKWTAELKYLRKIVLDCGLIEELKWGIPCYTFQQKNVVVLGALKEYCALSFFKGALLNDASNILDKPGENTQAARLIKFTSVKEIVEMEPTIKAYIYEAVEVEKAGLKVELKKTSEFEIPEEFQKALSENADLKAAFDALTPGRQRGYLLHFSQPKQSKTRTSRIRKCMPKIFDGKGLNDW